MLFPTVNFAIFFIIVYWISWRIRLVPVWWQVFLIAASWFFYGYWNPRFVFLIAGSTVGNWAAAYVLNWARERYGLDSAANKTLLGIFVAANLGVLGFFKYYNFFTTSVFNMLGDIGIHISEPVLEITLPIGISFFTFQAISYIVDVSRGRFAPASFLDFAMYLSFFPHVIAGPIVRASEFIPQIAKRPSITWVESGTAFRLIIAGLFKKVVISSYLASHIVDPVFAAPGQHSSLEVLFAIYGYAIQIYADFSGYTDIAIGCALLLGFRFPQNFDSPYASLSLQEFWRRWHMTLSRWLRDYLYIPVGGNHGSRIFTMRNLMITMVLGGLWHGAAWTFVIWGTIHGVGMCIERYFHRVRPRVIGSVEARPSPAQIFVQWFITFHVVCLAWVFFRAQSFTAAMDMLGRLFTGLAEASPLVTPAVLLAIGVSLAAQFIPMRTVQRLWAAFSGMSPAMQGAALAVALVTINAMGPRGVAPFIYFQF
ncbi:MBOAT family protein [bacterium]|jgi:D-alanyl-lipoteichoic acid acyltransferase DltB (MBOAT superfamily)|nr:MBOAT family protein [bacterium]